MFSSTAASGASATNPLVDVRVLRGALAPIVAIAASALAGTPSAARAAQAASPPPSIGAAARPNIVILRTDDQDLASMNERRPSGELIMKNVSELLTRRGVSFSNSFVTCSLCCPSRASFLTGLYVHNHGVTQNAWPEGGYYKLDHSNTLPIWMQKAGYCTCHIGKYLNDYGWKGGEDLGPVPDPTVPRGATKEIPPGWSHWFTTFWFAYHDYYVNDDGTIVHFGDGPADYHTDVMARKAVDFIAHPPAPGPFFLVVDFLAPHNAGVWRFDDMGGEHSGPTEANHDPHYPEPASRDNGVLDRFVRKPPPSFDVAKSSDRPYRSRMLLPTMSKEQLAETDARYRKRLESLIAVDDAVKAICDALEAAGRSKETYIFFVSDNGYLQGEHRLINTKLWAYEESIRVPLVVRGPGIPQGQVVDRLVTNLDYTPTIVELAHATAGLEPDGRSLVPLLSAPATAAAQDPSSPPVVPWRTDFLIEGTPLHFFGLRTEGYTYVEYHTPDGHDVDEIELYTLKADSVCPVADPFEMKNQAHNPGYAELVKKLSARLAELRGCRGAECR